MKFYLLSLGCQMNVSDGERVRTVLHEMNMEETKDENEAQLLGIMACSVRQKAIDKVYSTVHKWNKWKNDKSIFTFISGCILPADREKFLKKFDLLFAINELPHLKNLLTQYGIPSEISTRAYAEEQDKPHTQSTTHAAQVTRAPYITPARSPQHNNDATAATKTNDLARGFWQYQPSYTSTFSAFVTIQNGCDKFCTFCAVPYTRGREVSRASSEILAEVHTLMQRGYKSITLLGQNVNSYGLDTGGKELSFAQLLARIGNMAEEMKHTCWVYFTSPHPRDMGRDVLETIARYKALAKQIHLPLQSGDDKLLMKMNRNHSMVRYEKVMQDIGELLPDATVFTDIIVGFCGESRAQFENTKAAMQRYNYAMAYIAMYSPRIGAASSRWTDDIPLEEKKARYHELSQVLQATSRTHCERYLHKTVTVLVEDFARKGNVLRAHTEGKIPVYITVPSTMSHEHTQKTIGTFCSVHIDEVQSLSMKARFSKEVYKTIEENHAHEEMLAL